MNHKAKAIRISQNDKKLRISFAHVLKYQQKNYLCKNIFICHFRNVCAMFRDFRMIFGFIPSFLIDTRDL